MNEELINYAQQILHNRAMYWQNYSKRALAEGLRENGEKAAVRAGAYLSACEILLAAVLGDEENLEQFDYYAPD